MNHILMGILEGLTEFLPVSSTGHLILMKDLLKIQTPEGNVFEIAIQLGAILAVCVLYFKRLWKVAAHLHCDENARIFARNILLAFLPAVVVGLVAYGFIRDHLFNPTVVSVMLILGGVVILWAEKRIKTPQFSSIEAIPAKIALKIGIFQCFAMIPGTSRSGATIIGSLFMKLDRKTAAEFSFFLAIPTMFAATAKSLYSERAYLSLDDMEMIVTGTVAAFITALIVVKAAVGFVSRHGFAPFAYYRILLGSVMLGLIYLK